MTTEPQAASARAPSTLEVVRQIVLRVNDIGLEVTAAIEVAGLGEWSSNVDLAVLSRLALDGPTRPRSLVGPTRLTRGGLSNLLDRLESAGMITRSYGDVPGDRRGALATITEAGNAAASAIGDAVARSLKRQGPTLRELATLLDTITPSRARPARSGTGPLTPVHQLELLGRMGAALVDAFANVDEDDPTPGKTAVVLCSAAQPERTRPRELIQRTGLSSGGVSQLVDRLEHAGMVRRRTGQPPDHRAVTVELTPHGQHELERRLIQVSGQLQLIRSAFDELTPAGAADSLHGA